MEQACKPRNYASFETLPSDRATAAELKGKDKKNKAGVCYQSWMLQIGLTVNDLRSLCCLYKMVESAPVFVFASDIYVVTEELQNYLTTVGYTISKYT